MKTYTLLILAAIALSFSTAYFALNLDKNNIANPAEINKLIELQNTFIKITPVAATLDLSSMYPSRDYFQLIHPISLYTKSSLSSPGDFFSKNCLKTNNQMSSLIFDKNEIWENFRCKRSLTLPSNFFSSPPLIHESGMSYAYLAFLSSTGPFINSDWVKENINFFHVLELRNLPIVSLEGNYHILSKLEKQDLEGIEKGLSYILSGEYYLAKINDEQGIKVKVFKSSQLESYLKDHSIFIKPFREGMKCFYQEGNICWEKDVQSILELFRQTSLIVFLISILVLFFIILILFQKIKNKKSDDESKKHALRVLTHELRTPITNLLLQVESINKQSDLIPNNILEDLLRIEGEVYRLKRLAEKSTSYLKTHDGHKMISLVYQEVPSINNLILEMLQSFNEKDFRFTPCKNDFSLYLDSYWFNICLKNLVENAIVHGKGIVEVSLENNSGILHVNVSDQGLCTQKNLSEIFNADRVGKNNQGLGLGLSIVQKIMREMDGQLVFTKSPTTFSLLIRIRI